MSILRRFWHHESGSSFESLALILSVIAVVAVGTADLLHYATKKDGMIARFVAGLHTQVVNNHDGVDYTATGSIIGLRRGTTLNPCTGTDK